MAGKQILEIERLVLREFDDGDLEAFLEKLGLTPIGHVEDQGKRCVKYALQLQRVTRNR